jgi:hypothetical protein
MEARSCRFGTPEQFQEKCATVFRPELRENKELERFRISVKKQKRSRIIRFN